MHYFKHSELVTKYHVSLKTVHNWIDSAKQGKVELQLHEQNGRTYIANNPSNLAALVELSEKGKKYRNTLHHKVVTPIPRFYELFNPRQILDIIHNLSIHHEIPLKYSYFDGGATNWDKWVQKLVEEDSPSTPKSTANLLRDNSDRIDQLLEGHSKVNVIDIGVGNAMPARGLLAHFVERGVLNRYIAIDISEEMLRIAERNIKEWFGDKVKFEGHVRDISYERFDDLLVEDRLGNDSDEVANLALLLGATPVNFHSPVDILRTIYGSMSQEDLLIYTLKPDTGASRNFFGTSAKPGSGNLASTHSMALELLSVDKSLYELEMGYSEQQRMRYIRVKLMTALSIEFVFDHGKRYVHFEKGDTVLLWRARHQTPLEIISEFENVGFSLIQASLTKDREYLMTISGVEVKKESTKTND
jgi:SAM-dependent methyltransferase